jgi:hypothetical protein
MLLQYKQQKSKGIKMTVNELNKRKARASLIGLVSALLIVAAGFFELNWYFTVFGSLGVINIIVQFLIIFLILSTQGRESIIRNKQLSKDIIFMMHNNTLESLLFSFIIIILLYAFGHPYVAFIVWINAGVTMLLKQAANKYFNTLIE